MPAGSTLRLPYSEELSSELTTSLSAQSQITNDTDSTGISTLSVHFGDELDRFLSLPCTTFADIHREAIELEGYGTSDLVMSGGGQADIGSQTSAGAGRAEAARKRRDAARLCIRPPQDSEYDMSLTIEATSTEIFGGTQAVSTEGSGGKTAAASTVLGVTVEAINDDPLLEGVPLRIDMYEDYTEVTCLWRLCADLGICLYV
jgi:hypothetical protein